MIEHLLLKEIVVRQEVSKLFSGSVMSMSCMLKSLLRITLTHVILVYPKGKRFRIICLSLFICYWGFSFLFLFNKMLEEKFHCESFL